VKREQKTPILLCVRTDAEEHFFTGADTVLLEDGLERN